VAAKKVTIAVGMVSIATRIEPAVDEEASMFRTICTGEGTHDPVRCKQYMECPVCETRHSSHWGFKEKGIERDGTMVVVSAEELAAANGAPVTGRQGTMPVEVVFHPREKVYAATVAGDSVQNIYPDKGAEKAYVALRDTLAADPSLVACMIWAPGSKNALWTLEVVGHRLVATKRCWPEYVRPTVEIPLVEVSEVERQMFSHLVSTTMEDFDLGKYVDQAKLSKEELIASRTGTPIGAATLREGMASPNDVPSLMAAIEASLAAAGAKPIPKKAPAKKAAAKKPPAKKAAAPRKRAAKKPPLAKAG
jgi:DNA end-binding protein Ku